jgi:uncharacterized protein (UPF0335 family)
MSAFRSASYHQRLVTHVHDLERLEARKADVSEHLKEGFARAKSDGFDPAILRVVMKLRKLSPSQRRERRALEAIYLAELGMLDGDPLTDEARRRLDGAPADPPAESPETEPDPDAENDDAPSPTLTQPSLVLKEPSEARQEGMDAAEAGKRIYDNPYPAGDPCRAAWDEGWCAARKSHGMEFPDAYRRRSDTPAKDADAKDSGDASDDAHDADKKGAA